MPVIDLAFRLRGDQIPADHGYVLLGAIARIISAVHADDNIGIHPIMGHFAGNRMLTLDERSYLTFRLDSTRIPEVLPIAGTRLELDGRVVRVGTPQPRALKPSEQLHSRLVTIKGYLQPQPFLDAVKRQLDALGIEASCHASDGIGQSRFAG